jgi:3-hydroxybutyryl-CoA dehydratase
LPALGADAGAGLSVAAPPVGATLTGDLLLDAEAIRAGATLVGDFNPLHHDAEFAAKSRYGGLIASGAHTSAVLAGLVGRQFGQEGAHERPSVGMEYKVRFVAAIRVNRRMRMEWVVTSVAQARSGQIARMSGRIVDAEDGSPALTAELTVMYFGNSG